MSAAVHPLFILGLFAAANAAAAAQGTVVIENAHVSYTVSPGGKNLGFVDRATGLDYLRRGRLPRARWSAGRARSIPPPGRLSQTAA